MKLTAIDWLCSYRQSLALCEHLICYSGLLKLSTQHFATGCTSVKSWVSYNKKHLRGFFSSGGFRLVLWKSSSSWTLPVPPGPFRTNIFKLLLIVKLLIYCLMRKCCLFNISNEHSFDMGVSFYIEILTLGRNPSDRRPRRWNWPSRWTTLEMSASAHDILWTLDIRYPPENTNKIK